MTRGAEVGVTRWSCGRCARAGGGAEVGVHRGAAGVVRGQQYVTGDLGGLLKRLKACAHLCLSLPQLHQVLVQLQACEKEQDFASAPIPVSLSVQLWRLPGCHEFLAALGRTKSL